MFEPFDSSFILFCESVYPELGKLFVFCCLDSLLLDKYDDEGSYFLKTYDFFLLLNLLSPIFNLFELFIFSSSISFFNLLIILYFGFFSFLLCL